MKRLILASGSPRRKELLNSYGFKYEIIKSNFEEDNGETPVLTATNNALGKAKDVFDKLNDKNALVIGADTIVVFENQILGKPKDEQDAISMLTKLSGNSHIVITAYAFVLENKIITRHASSQVIFNTLSPKLITEYVATGSPLDKAGAYGVQDNFNVVKKVIGSINNVVGLPIEIMEEELKSLL